MSRLVISDIESKVSKPKPLSKFMAEQAILLLESLGAQTILPTA